MKNFSIHDADLTSCTATGITSSVARFTVVTTSNPERLTKAFELVDSRLEKKGGGLLISGEAEIKSIRSLQDFADIIGALGPNQALTYGIPAKSPIKLVTKSAWESAGKPDDRIPRTKETFSWPAGPGIMMLDYDPVDGVPALDRDGLIDLIRKTIPALANTELLWWPSASSHIVNFEAGEDLTGLRGQRVYIMVANASDIPRVGMVLFDRLWLAGRGRIKVSSSGTMLVRTVVDGAVWQPNRLDFAAGAHCISPLAQRRGHPELLAGNNKILDTAQAIPDLVDGEKKAQEAFIEALKQEKRSEADEKRNAWLDKRAREMVGSDAGTEELKTARQKAARVLKTGVLTGQFPLRVETKTGYEVVTVLDVLSQPSAYDGLNTLDPIEPEYDGGRAVGRLLLTGSRKVLHSFARGEKTYKLERGIEAILVPKGKLANAVDETVEILRAHPSFFDRGNDLVLVEHGKPHILNQDSLAHELGKIIQYVIFAKRGNEQKFEDVNTPPNLLKQILALGERRRLKKLRAVIDVPTLRLDGSILQEQGYDPESQLFLDIPVDGKSPLIEECPSPAAVRAALDRLWKPFDDFPFAGPVDRSVMLAALLTAAVRVTLPTAPAFGFDAPVQGSGKTLLASCVATLATSAEPRVYPHADGKTDEEIRKRLMSFYREGLGAMVWDNVLGVFDSASFAAALTSQYFADRILGKSETVSVPTCAIMLLTGNNLTLKGDMVRRSLICRIDPCDEAPHDRSFDLDPMKWVQQHRCQMIADCLTILLGGHQSRGQTSAGRLASFEDWSDLVRAAVISVGEMIKPGGFVDPVKALDKSLASDPDHEAWGELLAALRNLFGTKSFTARQVVQWLEDRSGALAARLKRENPERPLPSPTDVRETVGFFSEKALTSTKSLGSVFGNRKDRVADGLVLRSVKDAHQKQNTWRVDNG